jgi:hypothetical protein
VRESAENKPFIGVLKLPSRLITLNRHAQGSALS